MKKKGFGKFILGAAVGAGLGVLFAPKSGEETRKELKKKIDELLEKAKDIDIKEVKENIDKKIEEIKEELADLDKEKVLSLAKEQARHIKSKANDLVEYAKEKGTPVLEKAANSVKEKTIEVLEATLERLKEAENTKKAK
ncbi:MAG: YtxH domain-containing protein [Bacilli bacterium]|nr:YtxH domain-containing protein [Bacilli bacterium]